MKTIKFDSYCFKVKWGKKYIWPSEWYVQNYYTREQIASIIDEIETEFPRYKGKVKAFQMMIVAVK
jgi:hypothetical protein